IQVTRNFGENNQARIRLYRDVGQLDFGDFVSSPAFADSRIDGGNPSLVPETSYRLELGADWRFSGGAALGLALTQYWISDVADLVPLIDNNGTPGDPSDDITFDAPGNIGDGEGTRLDANLTLPLTAILPGGRFTMSGFIWRGEVTDPVTGRARALSDRSESQLDFELRQDLSDLQLAWSISLSKPGEVPFYRLNEVDTHEEGPWVDAYVETTALPYGMRLRLTAVNVFDGDIRRNRQIYLGDRNGPLDRVEWRYRQFSESPWWELRLSGSF
ncbi:MAG: TonB-dependent receptor, partial [Hyphomonadaceae bacterium]